MVTSKGRFEDVVPLRLVELRDPDGPLHAVNIARNVSVLAIDDGTRADEIARWLSAAIIGPRAAGADGVVEAGGQRGRLVDIPSELLDGIDSLVLDDLARAAARRRAGDSVRAELEIRGTALGDAVLAIADEHARARARLDDLDGRIQRLREERDATTETPLDPRRDVAARIQSLLDQLEIAAAQPLLTDPDAFALAAEWDALVVARETPLDAPPLDVAQARVDQARAAARRLEGDRLTHAKVAELHALARRVADAERALDAAKRSERAAAATQAEKARRAEAKALAALGFSSRAGFLVAIADGVPDDASDDAARRAAADEVAAAEAELERARDAANRPSPAQLEEQAIELRARAAQLLGHFPGDDVAADLRALRREPAIVAERRAALRDALWELGVDPAPDAAQVASAWLREHAAARAGADAAEAEAETRRRDLDAEIDMLRAERERTGRDLEQLALRLEAMELERDAAVRAHGEARDVDASASEPSEAEIEAALRDEARRLLDHTDAVRLPLVAASLLSVFGEGARARTLSLLEQLSEQAQVIVVAADPAIVQWARALGERAEVVELAVSVATSLDAPLSPSEAPPVVVLPDADLGGTVLPRRGRFRLARRGRGKDAERTTAATAPATVDPGPEIVPARDADHEPDVVIASTPETPSAHADTDSMLAAYGAPPNPAPPTLTPPSAPSAPIDLDEHDTTDAPVSAAIADVLAPMHAPDPSAIDLTARVDHDIDLDEPLDDEPLDDAPRSPGAALLAGAIAAELELARLSGDSSVVERLSRQVGARAQFYDPNVPLAACDGHPNIPTRLRCLRCHIPCCDLCSVVLGEPLELLCLDCALVASGARVRRHRRRGSLPRL
ncbi:MAG TPA: hypothetical protein VFZ83_00070 [Acidimicrobiia bacterium]|nr:hypothetical protein [Acidimicrobiia bacterium]